MTRKELYQSISYKRSGPSCESKTRYAGRADAVAAVFEHERRYVCEGMNLYRCKLHRCWHIGHRDKRRRAIKALRQSIEWFRMWERRN